MWGWLGVVGVNCAGPGRAMLGHGQRDGVPVASFAAMTDRSGAVVAAGEASTSWLAIAREGPVVRRALKMAVVVGTILLAINHGDALLRGDVDANRLLKMGLTYLVPYLVSTISSAGAIREMRLKQV